MVASLSSETAPGGGRRRLKKIRTLAVTGGTGFVGAHLLRLALDQGYDVRALTRGWKPPEDEIAWVDGALDRPDSLVKLCTGADAVIHIAGAINAPHRADFETVNAGGTAGVVDAARKAGVRRFIHFSSLAAREPELSAYGWSKMKSEKLVAASGLNWTILRPPAVYGPGDKETLELFRMARRGVVALPPRGHFSVIHVEDLCRLVLALLDEPDTWGETYEPDDGRVGGWEHRHFARTLGRLRQARRHGRHAQAGDAPRRGARPHRPPQQGQADAGPGPLFLPPGLGGGRGAAPAGAFVGAGGEDPHRPQGHGRLVSRARLARLARCA